MSNDAIDMVAARFKVLSEPLRLQLLQCLERGRLGVTDLADTVGSTQPNVSKHLKIMQESGIIARKQEGNNVYYYIADPTIFKLCELVCGSIKERLSERAALFV